MRFQTDEMSASRRLELAVGEYERNPTPEHLLGILRMAKELAGEIEIVRRSIYELEDRIEKIEHGGK